MNINKQILLQRIKLLAIIGGAFILSSIVSKTVFLAGTPRINTLFFAQLRDTPRQVVVNTQNFIAALQGNPANSETRTLQQFMQLPSTALNQIGTGVYAKEDNINNIIYIRVSPDAQFKEQTITMNGKTVTIRVPKGTFSK